MSRRHSLSFAAGFVLLAGCTVGPDYVRPDAPVPATFKEQEGWKATEPQDAIDRGPWWSIYQDPILDSLERKVEISNQTLKASEAAYRQARAAVDAARAGYFPSITGSGSFTRSHSGGGSRRGGVTIPTTSGGSAVLSGLGGSSTSNAVDVSAGASWEPDLWGRISRTVEADIATAQASAADLASAKLSTQATLAIDYFELRYQEELKRLLDQTVAEYQRSLQIAQNQYDAGVAAKADVLTARTQLINAQAAAINAGVARATLEHAIAVLTGVPPADFAISAAGLPAKVPTSPAGVPSSLLERRPDIAAAERRMAAANAQVGVAIAAYFPNLTLTASDGFTGSSFSHLFSSPNNVWSLGASLAQTIFDAGLRSAQVEEARAVFDQGVATYRQTVLTGFQQVEDQLSTLRILEQQSVVETEAVNTAREAARLTLNQYKAGTVPYSSVAAAQATALSTEQSALGVLQNRLVASVTLIEAIGGGWDLSKLPTNGQVEDPASFLRVIPAARETPANAPVSDHEGR